MSTLFTLIYRGMTLLISPYQKIPNNDYVALVRIQHWGIRMFQQCICLVPLLLPMSPASAQQCNMSQIPDLQNLGMAYYRQAADAQIAGDMETSCEAGERFLRVSEKLYKFMAVCGSLTQQVQFETGFKSAKRSASKFCGN